MAGLNTLDALNTLRSLDPAAAVGNAAVGAASAVAGAVSGSGTNSGPSYISRIVIIILGLMLIAAGIFSFDKTRELVVEGAKAAAVAA